MNTEQRKRLEKYLPEFNRNRNTFSPETASWVRDTFVSPENIDNKSFYFAGYRWSNAYTRDYFAYSAYVRSDDDWVRDPVLTISTNEWENAYKYLKEKYEKQKREFEKNNLIWKKLVLLDSARIKQELSETGLNGMRQLYKEQLAKDSDYQDLQEFKKDLYAIDAKIKEDRKEEKKEERESLKNKLHDLRNEYSSDKVKKAIPDVKERLALRKIMRKTVEGEK